MIPEEKLQELQSEFKSKYYNAVSDYCFELLSKYSEDELDNTTREKLLKMHMNGSSHISLMKIIFKGDTYE